MRPEREALIVAVARAIGFLSPTARVPTDRLVEAAAALDAIEAHGVRLVPITATAEMLGALRQSLRASGLLPSYTDEGAGGQLPLLHHFLGTAWPLGLAASPYAPSSNDEKGGGR